MQDHLLQATNSAQLQTLLLALAILGVLIIIFSIILFFTKYEIKDKIQQIKLLGADLRISLVTFFVFIGLLLIVPIIYTNYVAALTEINTLRETNTKDLLHLQTENADLRKRLDETQKGQTRDFVFLLDLDSSNNLERRSPSDFEVQYTFSSFDSAPELADEPQIFSFGNKHLLGTKIKSQKPETVLSRLDIKDKRNNKLWRVEGMTLGQPVIVCKLQKE